MSRIRADRIVDRAATGAPLFPNGAVVTGVATATTFDGNATSATSATSAAGLTGVANTENVIGTAITMTTGNITGNLTVGGVLTYDDVTNVDSIGIVTARSGVKVVGGGVSITAGGLHVTAGVTTVGGGLTLTDNVRAKFGTDGDLQIYHDGSNAKIINTTGQLWLQSDNGIRFVDSAINESFARFTDNGAVELYYDGTKKLDTSATGVTVTGTLAATAVTGDGSGLSNLPASGIGTAAATVAGIVTTLDLSSAQDHKITVSGISTVTVKGGSEGDSHTVRITNSGITTVGFSTFFLFPSGADPSMPTASGAISLISFTVHRVGAGGTQLLAGAALNYS